MPATVISASITRESSPPDAASRIGAAGTPWLGASMNSTRSAPLAPTSSLGSSTTSNDAPSIASDDSSSTTRFARRRPCLSAGGSEAAGQLIASAARFHKRRLGALGLDLGALEARSLGAAALSVREHRGHAAAVLALEPVVQLEALLDDVEPAGLGLERVGIAPQLRAEVLRLQAKCREALRQDIELRIGSRHSLREVLGPRQQRGHPRLVAARRNRLRPGARGGEQAVQLAQARSLRLERALLLLARVELLDLLDLERQQVEVTVARAGALAQLGQRRLQLAHPRVGCAHAGAQLELVGPAETVEQVELCRGEREPPVLVLPEEGDHPAAERLKVGGRGGAALHEGARAALGADPPGQHHLLQLLAHALAKIGQLGMLEQPRRELEHALHVCLRGTRPDDARAWLTAQQQIERVSKHGLAGARLPRDRGEPGTRPQLRPLDQEQVLYAQLEQHRSGVPARPDGAAGLSMPHRIRAACR